MQFLQATLVLALAASAMALPGATGPTTLETVPTTFSRSADLADVAASSSTATHSIDHSLNVDLETSEEAAQADKKCFKFTSDNKDWHFANTGVWGSKTGTFGSLSDGKLCVPKTTSAGGAMFIGTSANPSAGNTKLECFFPPSGQASCDMSLVDGYSLSVTCKDGSTTYGGNTNLWKTGKKCDDPESPGICKNDEGYAPKQSDVTAFFQEGLKGGNKYCIWQDCSIFTYPMTNDVVECHVSGGK